MEPGENIVNYLGKYYLCAIMEIKDTFGYPPENIASKNGRNFLVVVSEIENISDLPPSVNTRKEYIYADGKFCPIIKEKESRWKSLLYSIVSIFP